MKTFPAPAECKDLLEKMETLFEQRFNFLEHKATTYKIEGRALQTVSGAVFQVTNNGGVYGVFLLRGEVTVNVANWSVSERIEFLKYFDNLVDIYAEDVESAYAALRYAALWVDVK